MTRIPRELRSAWMAEHHETRLDKKMYTVNLDSIGEDNFLAYQGDELSYLIEYKNATEPVRLWNWSIKNQAKLATNSKIPFFVIFGDEKEKCFYIVGGNKIANDLPIADKWFDRWISEMNYVKFLYFCCKRIAPKEILEKLDNRKPTITTIPDIRG